LLWWPFWIKNGRQNTKILRFGRNLVSNMIESKTWALIISCYVLTLFFIHTTSTCIVRLGDICNALRYSNQYFLIKKSRWSQTFEYSIVYKRFFSWQNTETQEA
jgi:hypothetical protein